MRETYQRSALQEQAGENFERMRSLILFWGNRTIYTEDTPQGKTLGGLSKAVFKAFDLKMIQGQPLGEKIIPPIGHIKVEIPEVDIYRDKEKYERYKKDISNWQDGGSLDSYDVYSPWVVQFWRDSIQWAEYGISQFQAFSRLTPGRIHFEGQRGEKAKSQIRFPRNGLMADVLQALAQLEFLNVPLNTLKDSEIGAISSTLSKWRADYEGEVTRFISSISEETPAPLPIHEMSIFNNLMLNTLGGYFSKTDLDPIQVYEGIISIAYQKPDWSNTRNEKFRSEKWMDLCNRIPRDQPDHCRINLLSLLNLPQGSRSSTVNIPNVNNAVYILDAQKALAQIETFSEHFEPKKLQPIRDIDDSIWNYELPIYLLIQDMFVLVLQDQIQKLNKELDTIQKYLGTSKPQEVLHAFRKVELTFNNLHRVYDAKQRPDLTGDLLQQLLTKIKKLVNETRTNHLALQLSASSAEIRSLADFLDYFNSEYERLQKQSKILEERLAVAPGGLNESEKQRILKLYEELDQHLQETIDHLTGGNES